MLMQMLMSRSREQVFAIRAIRYTPGFFIFFILGFFLQEEPIRGFRVCDYLPFMEELERSYRAVVLIAMKDICSAVA